MKKIISIILCNVILLSLAITTLALAPQKYLSSDKFEYTLENGKATIVGWKGDYKAEKKKDSFTFPAVIDGYPVEEIGDIAFYVNEYAEYSESEPPYINLFCEKKVIISEGIKTIGEKAFSSCNMCSSTLVLPDSLTEIGSEAFYCSMLQSVQFGENLKKIDTDAFCECYLKTLNLTASIEYIGEGAFYGNRVETLTMPENLTYIGDSAFARNRLTAVELPAKLTYIGSHVFADNAELCTITARCPKLEFVGKEVVSGTSFYNNGENWENGVLYLADIAFLPLNTSDVTVRDGTRIIAQTFFDMSDSAYLKLQIKTLTLPGSLERICKNALRYSVRGEFDTYYKGNIALWKNVIIDEDDKSINLDKLHFVGDADGDGNLTAFDVMLLRRLFSGKITADNIDILSADFDKDGKLTAKDLFYIRKELAA